MKAILLRTISALAGILILAVGLAIVWGGSLLYLSEVATVPPPLWKSAVIVGLLALAAIASCWVSYKLIRYAICPLTKTVLSVAIATVAVVLFALGIRYELKHREQIRRQTEYQAALSEYIQALKPGMTRRQVEDYIQSNNAKFTHTCCVDSSETAKRHTWDDLVRIGQEEHPWFCSEHNVYIAFQFTDHEQQNAGFQMEDNDLDKLKAVTIYHSMEGCL
jgi:hypothetical protein